MRVLNYEPLPPIPNPTVEDLNLYIANEFQSISAALQQVPELFVYPNTTNLDALKEDTEGYKFFSFLQSATGSPSLGFNYDGVGMQINSRLQTSQLVSCSDSSNNRLLIRIDDGSGFNSWTSIV